MSDPIYTARAHVTGGRNGHGRTEDGALDIDLKGPVEMGGPGGAVNPEQLFAVGYAACFESTVRATARRAQLDPKGTSINSKVMLFRVETGGTKLGVELDITMPAIDDAQKAVELVREAHQNCVYSRATRGNIDVTLIANGLTVD